MMFVCTGVLVLVRDEDRPSHASVQVACSRMHDLRVRYSYKMSSKICTPSSRTHPLFHSSCLAVLLLVYTYECLSNGVLLLYTLTPQHRRSQSNTQQRASLTDMLPSSVPRTPHPPPLKTNHRGRRKASAPRDALARATSNRHRHHHHQQAGYCRFCCCSCCFFFECPRSLPKIVRPRGRDGASRTPQCQRPAD